MSLLPFVVLTLLFGAGNRVWGGGAPKLDAATPGKLGGELILLGALACGLFYGPAAALYGLAFWGQRSLGFHVFGGSLNPQTPKEIVGSVVRFMVVMIGFVLVSLFRSPPHLVLADSWGLLYVLLATILSVYYGVITKKATAAGVQLKGDPNATIEFLNGAAFGLAVALANTGTDVSAHLKAVLRLAHLA